MKIAIPAEADLEPRVAATPDTVKKMKALGAESWCRRAPA
jgi:NAD/NADP transhydrogenase alpha subunit